MTPRLAGHDVFERLRKLDDTAELRAFLEPRLAILDDALLRSLKDRSERDLDINPRAALGLAEGLIEAARLVGSPEHLGLGLIAKGDALRALGRCPESLTAVEEAARTFLAHANEVGWARTRISLLFTLRLLGRGAEALAFADDAFAILVRHGEWLRAAQLSLNAGIVFWEQGRYDRAIELYDRAIALYDRARQANDHTRELAELRTATAKANKALIFTLWADFQAALALHQEAREVFIRHDELASVLREDFNVAYVYAAQGHYTRALRLYVQTIAALESVGLNADAATAALDAAECYLNLNRHADALAMTEETTARFERLAMPTEAAKARFFGAMAYARLGNVESALELLNAAARTFETAGLTRHLGLATLQRARLYLDSADWSAALLEAGRAQEIFGERGLIVHNAQAELVQARALLALGRADDAATFARAALTTAHAHDALWLDHEGHHILAGVARAHGNKGQALAECETGIRSIEHLQSRLAAELRTNFLDDKLSIYHDAIDLALGEAKPELAFAYLERAKSRALVDYLTGHPEVRLRTTSRADPTLIDELTRLRGEHNWFYNRLYGPGLVGGPASAGAETGALPEADVASLRAAIQVREKRISRIVEQLALVDAEGMEVMLPALAGHDFAPSVLDERSVLVEYYFRDDGGWAFVVSSAGLSVLPLAARPGAIRSLLRRWQLNLAAVGEDIAAGRALDGLGRNARGILEALYRALLAPIEGHLAGQERIVVVPYGVAHGVPFSALHDGRRYLIESWEVSVCPSSSLLRLCNRRPRRGCQSALVVAYSDDGRLPGVLDEARAIAEIVPAECYLEARATRDNVIEAAPRHALVHLAAHGESRLDNPMFAHLKLADGQLSPIDVFNLELDGALVTLSACESGRYLVTSGDELIGLSRGFLYAGAASLVQSLWQVEDNSTARLMASFYRGLRLGQSKGAALRAAQRGSLDDRGSHPYFWAPFQLVGDSGFLS